MREVVAGSVAVALSSEKESFTGFGRENPK
jgi:hypothetical protein